MGNLIDKYEMNPRHTVSFYQEQINMFASANITKRFMKFFERRMHNEQYKLYHFLGSTYFLENIKYRMVL